MTHCHTICHGFICRWPSWQSCLSSLSPVSSRSTLLVTGALVTSACHATRLWLQTCTSSTILKVDSVLLCMAHTADSKHPGLSMHSQNALRMRKRATGCFCVCSAGLACSSLWLYYTICPAARQRDSKSRPPPQQQRYSCDIGWDIFWAVMWGLCFIFAGVGAGRVPTAASFATALFSAVMVSLFIASAVVSRRVQLRSCMQGVAPPESTGAAAAANKDVECAGGGLDICTVPAAAPNGMWASGRMGVDSKPQLSQVV